MSPSAPAAPPLLSVIIPAYQVEQYLPRCLDSVLAEPAPQLEVILVDDGSPDRSVQVADWYARRDPRLRVMRLPTNAGLGRARNAGLARARGSYLWFVDGDDWLPPGSVPAVLSRLAATGPEVLVVDHVKVFPDGRREPADPSELLAAPAAPGPLLRRPELLQLAHSACTKVVQRSFLDRIGLRFHPGWYEDSSYSHPLLLAAGRIDTLDRVCYCYRQRGGGAITGSVSARHFQAFAQYQRMWAAARHTGESYHRFRPELFRLMIDHLLVIAGNDGRLPRRLRRDFFCRVADEYHRWLPATGYPVPGGLDGLKHRLVRWRAYEPYLALRTARRAASWLSRRVPGAAARSAAPPRPASRRPGAAMPDAAPQPASGRQPAKVGR